MHRYLMFCRFLTRLAMLLVVASPLFAAQQRQRIVIISSSSDSSTSDSSTDIYRNMPSLYHRSPLGTGLNISTLWPYNNLSYQQRSVITGVLQQISPPEQRKKFIDYVGLFLTNDMSKEHVVDIFPYLFRNVYVPYTEPMKFYYGFQLLTLDYNAVCRTYILMLLVNMAQQGGEDETDQVINICSLIKNRLKGLDQFQFSKVVAAITRTEATARDSFINQTVDQLMNGFGIRYSDSSSDVQLLAYTKI